MIEDNYCGAVNMTLTLSVGGTIPAQSGQIMQENPSPQYGRYPQAEIGPERDESLSSEKDLSVSPLRQVKSA